eukprot:10942763-Ditylum_brightwellii.AAC.1
MFGLNNRTTHNVFDYLYTNYGHVTPHMMTQADTHIRQAFNLSLPMENFLEQFDVTQDLCTAGHNPYLDVQLINIGFDLIFRMAVHNDACKEWLRRPPADKTWANFCTHFTEAHRYLHELQANAPDTGYTANN